VFPPSDQRKHLYPSASKSSAVVLVQAQRFLTFTKPAASSGMPGTNPAQVIFPGWGQEHLRVRAWLGHPPVLLTLGLLGGLEAAISGRRGSRFGAGSIGWSRCPPAARSGRVRRLWARMLRRGSCRGAWRTGRRSVLRGAITASCRRLQNYPKRATDISLSGHADGGGIAGKRVTCRGYSARFRLGAGVR
jgi:hypothetical protein